MLLPQVLGAMVVQTQYVMVVCATLVTSLWMYRYNPECYERSRRKRMVEAPYHQENCEWRSAKVAKLM